MNLDYMKHKMASFVHFLNSYFISCPSSMEESDYHLKKAILLGSCECYSMALKMKNSLCD